MKEYKTLSPVTIVDGVIGLSDVQADTRAHLVSQTKKKGVYTILRPVTFKAGETILLPSVSKDIEPLLEGVSEAEVKSEG